jgi:hypothetical protein
MQGFPKNFMVIYIHWFNIVVTFQKIAEHSETIQNRALFSPLELHFKKPEKMEM